MKAGVSKTISYIYLLLVPVITAGLGFGVGHVSYKLYLPIWLLNAVLMIIAAWSLGLNVIRAKNQEKNNLARTAFFLVVPWILISLFAGFGPPPETAAEWTDTATEQKIRYFILIISGVFIAFGFAGIRDSLYTKGEKFYSRLSLTAILIAIPLFIINMLYWGFYLTELFRIQATAHTINFPDWFLPIKQLFGLISVTEVALTYFATFALVLGMRKIGWLSNTSSFFYMLFSLLSCLIIILSVFFSVTLEVPAFAVSIPAFPFLMPYFIGVNLLRQTGKAEIG